MQARHAPALVLGIGSKFRSGRLGHHACFEAPHVHVTIGKHVLSHILIVTNEYLTGFFAGQGNIGFYISAHHCVFHVKREKIFH